MDMPWGHSSWGWGGWGGVNPGPVVVDVQGLQALGGTHGLSPLLHVMVGGYTANTHFASPVATNCPILVGSSLQSGAGSDYRIDYSLLLRAVPAKIILGDVYLSGWVWMGPHLTTDWQRVHTGERMD